MYQEQVPGCVYLFRCYEIWSSTTSRMQALKFIKKDQQLALGGTDILKAMKMTLSLAAGKSSDKEIKDWKTLFSSSASSAPPAKRARTSPRSAQAQQETSTLPLVVILVSDGAISNVKEVCELLEEVGKEHVQKVIAIGVSSSRR